MASPSLWVTVRALDELPLSLCHRYRVSAAQSPTGGESHLFTSRLRVADSSNSRVTGCGGGQISFWNFNLLQLNYLISEPHTSKEYLRSLLPGCPDGGFHSRLLKDSPILYLYPVVWMKSELYRTNKPQYIKSCGSWSWNYSTEPRFCLYAVFSQANFAFPVHLWSAVIHSCRNLISSDSKRQETEAIKVFLKCGVNTKKKDRNYVK